MTHQVSETLKSRTFVGLLLAQFTATFNDQAIHMVAVFYATDMLVRFVEFKPFGLDIIDEKAVVSIVTACFITPFLLFSSFAGILGDRFSKRTVIVFWKVAEVFMMGLAFAGLYLPHTVATDSASMPTLATWSAIMVIATVFLMGMHSTFFVPAKLGAMPEILHSSILSRGNGILEGTSFTAQILGTSAGGILYSLLKGEVFAGKFEPGREWWIGALLFGLALFGTVTAFLMERIPAAAPNRKLTWNWWRPLKENLMILWRSKPLTLSVTGIAFCVFLTLFLRQTLLYQGELNKELRGAKVELTRVEGKPAEEGHSGMDRLLARILPAKLERAARESELRVALLFALVGLGVGLGSIVAGYLSGHRVELGLVPVGAVSIIVFTLLPAIWARSAGTFVVALFGIGCGAGFYLVPLYTLMQQRAPKENKGNVVAASNFLNVVGGIISVAVFYLLSAGLDGILGANLTERMVAADPSLLPEFVAELESELRIPQLLFLATSLMTAGAILVMRRRMPDFEVRTAIWLRSWGHNPLEAIAIEHMPLDGPVILAANCDTLPAVLDLIAAVDRYPRVIFVERVPSPQSFPFRLARRCGMVALSPSAPAPAWDAARRIGAETLQNREMVALTISEPSSASQVERLLTDWRQIPKTTIVPVYCSSADPSAAAITIGKRHAPPRVIFGDALPPGSDSGAIRAALARLAQQPPTEHGSALKS